MNGSSKRIAIQWMGNVQVLGAAAAILFGAHSATVVAQTLEELPAPRMTSPTSSAAANGIETVRERHPDGRVAVERQVALDEEQNYVNHGPYQSFDEAGGKKRVGQYRQGKAHGLWTSWYRGHETPLLQEPPYTLFQPPFVSQASFRDDQLEGTWTIFDSQQRKISEINYTGGQRSGPAVWWYPNGGKMRELTFHNGLLQGTATFYRNNGQVARREKYESGHKVQQVTQRYPNRAKQAEGMYRFPQIIMVGDDNWWDMQLGTFEVRGEGSKEGRWTLFYPNGQKQMAGVYQRDKATGEFTWWHETGQRALVGNYKEGVKAGQWTWWHPNGMKMSRGAFREDNPEGLWAAWDADGHLLQEIKALEGHDTEVLVSSPSSRDSGNSRDSRTVNNEAAEELPAPNPILAADEQSMESLPAPLSPNPFPSAMPSLISAPRP